MNCHPERVRKISETSDLFELKLPHFYCVGTVQHNVQTGAFASRLSGFCVVRFLHDLGRNSCRDLGQFLVDYCVLNMRFQCGEDDGGGLLNHFQRLCQ